MNMKITQIKETCLYVQNLSITKEFYNLKLDLPVISSVDNRHIFFRAGSSVLLCFNPEATKAEANLPPHFAYGFQHIAFEVGVAEYQPWLKKIENAGIEIIHLQEWKKGLQSFYFKDPDGHVLEIVPEGIWE